MTSGVEQLGLSSRPLSGVLVNQPPIQITEAIAKELQLRDGQIVKALVEHGGKHLLLSANERSFRLPVGSIYSAVYSCNRHEKKNLHRKCPVACNIHYYICLCSN